MNIVFFTDIFLPNIDGVTTSSNLLMRGLKRAGHNILVITPTKPDPNDPELEGIQVVSVPSMPSGVYPDIRLGIFSPTMIKRLREFKPDFVYSITPPLPIGITGRIYAELMSLPHAGFFHGYFMKPEYIRVIGIHYGVDTVSKLLWKLAQGIFNRYQVVISPSQTVADDLSEHGFSSPIKVIPNAIDFSPAGTGLAAHNSADKSAPGDALDPDVFLAQHNLAQAPIILYVGRLSKEKSIDDLLKSFALLIQQQTAAKPATEQKAQKNQPRLLLIGDGPERAELEQLTTQLGIQNAVVFAGKIPNHQLITSGLLERASAFASCSTSEVQPMSFIEALHAGLPLVLVDNPQNKEFVEGARGQETGLLVAPDDHQAFAVALGLLINDPQKRAKHSAAARKRAAQHDLKHITKQHEELMRELIESTHAEYNARDNEAPTE